MRKVPKVNITCKIKDVGLEHFYQCMEKDPEGCQYALSYGAAHFCRYFERAQSGPVGGKDKKGE